MPDTFASSLLWAGRRSPQKTMRTKSFAAQLKVVKCLVRTVEQPSHDPSRKQSRPTQKDKVLGVCLSSTVGTYHLRGVQTNHACARMRRSYVLLAQASGIRMGTVDTFM